MRVVPIIVILTCVACSQEERAVREMPDVETYCLDAQRIVTNTIIPMELVVHEDFMGFVKSKAVIEGPTIQQYNWRDDQGNVVGISCKLKSADHLNLEFGEGSAGPDGTCQQMNQEVFRLAIYGNTNPAYTSVVFDPDETVADEDQPGMTGPLWLAPYEATSVDEEGALHIRSKGFIVDFTDPQFAKAPARFRGVHYCHFLAPDYMRGLMQGTAEPGLVIGKNPEMPDGTPVGRGY